MSGPANPVTRHTDPDTARWLERHGAALRQYFRRRVAAADVDDLVQEVLLKLQTATVGSDVTGAERYLFTIARNVLIDRRRLERTHDLRTYQTYARIGETDDRLSPERILLAREECARVQRAIMKLPPRARAAFEFHRFENMTYTEIAAAMRISRETVKDLVRRALTGIMAERPGAEFPDD